MTGKTPTSNDIILYATGDADDETRRLVENHLPGGQFPDPHLQQQIEDVRSVLDSLRINLKQVLMELGNRLVMERGFAPDVPADCASTQPIKDFAEYLNNTPDAQEILAEMGVEWP
jgi:hypothetical protein